MLSPAVAKATVATVCYRSYSRRVKRREGEGSNEFGPAVEKHEFSVSPVLHARYTCFAFSSLLGDDFRMRVQLPQENEKFLARKKLEDNVFFGEAWINVL